MNTPPTQFRVPSTSGQLARWLLRVARPVLTPLVASTLFRIVGQAAGVALLVTAAGVVAAAAVGELTWGVGAVLWLLAGLALIKALCAYLEQYTGHLVAFKALVTCWPVLPRISTGSRHSSPTRLLPPSRR